VRSFETSAMNLPTSRPRGHVRRVAIGVGVLSLVPLGLTTAQAAPPTTEPAAEPAADGTTLYTVDLKSGAATALGSVGTGLQLVGLAISPDVGNVYGLTDAGELATFSVDDLTAVTTAPITGVDGSDPLVGIDRRPADGSVVGISEGGVVYTIDVDGATATALGAAIDPALESGSVGFDFNPTVDRIRVGASTGQNLRLNPDTGAVGQNPDTGAPTIDGKLTFADGDVYAGTAPKVVGAAYTNSVAGATRTQLYVVDAATGVLALQAPPNDGILNTVGALGVDLPDSTSFDIAANGDALLAVPSAAFGATADAPATLTSGPGCAAVPTDGEGSFEGMADDPAATAASNNPQLSTLASAVEAAGLTDTLNGEGPFTIFAPSNSAFGKIPPADLEGVLADPQGVLTDVLTLHVIAGQQLSSSDLVEAGTVDSLNGTLTIDQFGDRVTVDAGSGQAIVVCGDIETANATVHIIDSVLLPGSMVSG
jgi:uncharacterized surface protein with fasciclin (FAS1) repeats